MLGESDTKKYLAYSRTQEFILATGQLFNSKGVLVNCDISFNYIKPGMIVIGGVGAITGSLMLGSAGITQAAGGGGTPPGGYGCGRSTWRQSFCS